MGIDGSFVHGTAERRKGDRDFVVNSGLPSRTRSPRFHIHLTPTSSSRLNLIERWFGEMTRKQICRGVFKSVDQLKAAIQSFVDQHNANPKGFVWTKTAQQILTKVDRARRAQQALDKPNLCETLH